MKLSLHHRLLALTLPLAALLAACDASPNDARRPNIVLVVVDTLRGDMVLDGEADLETPGFDRLAEGGVVFPKAFSHAPMTLPSHTSLFSSRAPFETGVLNNWQEVPKDLPLLAEWLQRYDYQTRAVVSLGTLDSRKKGTLARGFDVFDHDYWNIDQAPNALKRIRSVLDDVDPEDPLFLFAHFSDPHAPYNLHDEEGQEAEIFLNGELLDRVPTSHMTQWKRRLPLEPGQYTLEIRSEAPFRINAFDWKERKRFLGPTWEVGQVRNREDYVRIVLDVDRPRNSVLRIWVAEAVQSLAEQRERYRGEVRWMDRWVGDLSQELRDRGLWDDTIVVFTSDHGEGLGEHGDVGHVQNLHDEMLHVPLVVKPAAGDPRYERLAAARDELVPHLDIVPTLLDLAGIPLLPGASGSSLLRERDPLLVAETHKPEAKRNLICIRDDAYKLIYDVDAESFELFDMRADPDELVNVYDTLGHERPEWAERLRQIGELARSGAMLGGEASPETQELLSALGYGGDA